jgi:hypothetical protein
MLFDQSEQNANPKSRSTAILVLGILSIVLLGPFVGIPAWVMGHTDLARIKSGLLPASKKTITTVGMIAGIVGTVVGTIWIIQYAVAVSTALTSYDIAYRSVNRDAIIADLTIIAQDAYAFRERSESNSYSTFVLQKDLARNENGRYSIVSATSDTLIVRATSEIARGEIVAIYGPDGNRVGEYSFTGAFKELPQPK